MKVCTNLCYQIDIINGRYSNLQYWYHIKHKTWLAQTEMSQTVEVLYLRPQHTDDDGPQLLVLPSETSHVIQTRLELPMGRAQTPHHLQVLLTLPLDDVPQKHLQLLVLVLPSLEHLEARHHHL